MVIGRRAQVKRSVPLCGLGSHQTRCNVCRESTLYWGRSIRKAKGSTQWKHTDQWLQSLLILQVRKTFKRWISAALGLSHWPCSFSLRDWPANLLLIRGVERKETSLAVLRWSPALILGTAPLDKGQVGWSTINHSLFLLSAGTREVTSSPNTSRHTRCLLIFFFLYCIYLSLPP